MMISYIITLGVYFLIAMIFGTKAALWYGIGFIAAAVFAIWEAGARKKGGAA